MTLDSLRFDDRGLVPVIAQDVVSGEVLMLAYADREAVEATLATSLAHYHSRSRGGLWRKGETSGHDQHVVEIRYDCDEDALLYRVEQTGPACHTGHRSCFYRTVGGPEPDVGTGDEGAGSAATDADGHTDLGEILAVLETVVASRLRSLPEGSYVRRVHERGVGYAAQKVVEEAGESVVAALEGKDDALVAEAADLLFHLLLLLAERGVSLQAVADELASRHRDTPERS
ncbi:MAG: bifunctional phosphoribosyl-AMP cyclohydrolase/phosphoribosyl-ATP diphosphatase HisIE [Deinococcales bacterium]